MKNIKTDEVTRFRDTLKGYEIMKHLNIHNVLKERVELYRDFVVNLAHYIHTSYFGKEYIKTEADVKAHYAWAFNKVLSDFEEEGVVFGETRTINHYFYNYFLNHFYALESTPSINSMVKFWDEVFSIKNQKDKTEMNAMTEIYAMFDDAFNKKIILIKM